MKSIYLLLLLFFTLNKLDAQIISQYIETSSGSTPKGIELWNNTPSTLDFSIKNLVIEKGTNGAIPSPDFTINSGSLASGDVLVIGTTDIQGETESNGSQFFLKAFTFNGDDALVVKYGGIICDIFGMPGIDPGVSWSLNGVSTANQNIALKEGIETGDIDGWIDPSERYETISSDNTLSGFGIAPIRITGTLTVDRTVFYNFIYSYNHGPSESQYFILSGNTLSNSVMITPPEGYELSSDNNEFSATPIIVNPVSGTLDQIPIYVRLEAGLDVGPYNNKLITISSLGALSISVVCNGRVKYRDDMELPNAWINEFHYDNIGTDTNEFIEVVIENSILFDLHDFTVSLYNGSNGTLYDTLTGDHFIKCDLIDSFQFFTCHPSNIQNGSPDGMSLDFKGESILFISYEGKFRATEGAAMGLLSIDTGVFEDSEHTPSNHSLQLVGNGSRFIHFRWIDPEATPGKLNSYQFLGPYLPAVPFRYWTTFGAFVLLILITTIRYLIRIADPNSAGQLEL